MILYTNGCCFTLGYELKEPHISAWPYILGSMLQCDVINEACNVGGGLRVLRKTLNFLFNNEDKLQDIFIIIGWENRWAFEVFYKTKLINLKLSETRNKSFNTFLQLTQLPLYHYKQNLYYKKSLQEVLYSYKIPHIFFDALSPANMYFNKGFLDINKIQYFNNSIQNQVLKNSTFVEYTLKHNYKQSNSGHPLEDAHIAFAKFLYEKIIKI